MFLTGAADRCHVMNGEAHVTRHLLPGSGDLPTPKLSDELGKSSQQSPHNDMDRHQKFFTASKRNTRNILSYYSICHHKKYGDRHVLPYIKSPTLLK